ncbi:polysaccharide deacetylase family protein [Streptomyces vinaceus]|uniref:polysaccharide deacetylase family protein n=1 Tax=Streptomyces vinaceus TaxID=1960 RepID=UPI0035DF687D
MSTKNRVRCVAAASVLALAALVGGAGAASAAPVSAAHGSAGAAVGPRGSLPGKVPAAFTNTSEGGPHTVDVTIDDGPSPAWTPKVLAVLAQNHVKATFCMIGENAAKYPALVKEVAAAGHRLCDHSVDHDMTMDKKSVAYQEGEILGGQALVNKAAGGPKAMYYRAPGGAFTPASRQVAAEHGLRPLNWDIDPRDWSRPGTANIIAAVKEQVHNGPIVLFHDGGGDRSQTVAALQKLLPWFKQQGYGFSFPSQTAP